MARPKIKTIEVSDEDRRTLEEIASSRTERSSRVNRARGLLLYLDGTPNTKIAEIMGISVTAFSKFIDKCVSIGPVAAIDDLSGRGRKKEITDNDKCYVRHIACYKPKEFGYPEELWTYNKLAKHIREHCVDDQYPNLVNVNKSMVYKILEEEGMKPHRIRYYLEHRDPEFEKKMKEVLLVYKEVQMAIETNTDSGVITISYDEKPTIQALGSTVDDERMSDEHGFIARDSDYIRYGTVNLLAGLNLNDGEIIPLIRETHNSKDFIDFLKIVDSKYPKDKKIRFVLDNLKVHSSKEVMQYLSTVPNRFIFVFTPKHGSWLNLVESFFGKLSRSMLRGIRVSSKKELEERIYAYIDEVNREPVVYRWTYKMEELEV